MKALCLSDTLSTRLLRYVKEYKHYAYVMPQGYLMYTMAVLVFLHLLR